MLAVEGADLGIPSHYPAGTWSRRSVSMDGQGLGSLTGLQLLDPNGTILHVSYSEMVQNSYEHKMTL